MSVIILGLDDLGRIGQQLLTTYADFIADYEKQKEFEKIAEERRLSRKDIQCIPESIRREWLQNILTEVHIANQKQYNSWYGNFHGHKELLDKEIDKTKVQFYHQKTEFTEKQLAHKLYQCWYNSDEYLKPEFVQILKRWEKMIQDQFVRLVDANTREAIKAVLIKKRELQTVDQCFNKEKAEQNKDIIEFLETHERKLRELAQIDQYDTFMITN